ncbi:hypothetical protein MKX03_015894 [Papaver bracteatum]|nr:hypothetical protein MKX03_015894 [Papaver bracteatum]
MVNRVGRKRIQLDLHRIKLIPLRKRTTIRGITHALNLSTTTVHRRIKDGNLRPHSNVLRPELTDENKITRVNFCLNMIDKGMTQSSNSIIDMLYRIHIDKKCFRHYESKSNEGEYEKKKNVPACYGFETNYHRQLYLQEMA